MTYEQEQIKFKDQLLVILKDYPGSYDNYVKFIDWGDKERPIINSEFMNELPEEIQGSVQALVDGFKI